MPDDSLWNSLPRPLAVFGVLLLVEFIMVFAFAFIEPQLVFYLYEDLELDNRPVWRTDRLSMAWPSVVGQLTLSRLSDKLRPQADHRRRPVAQCHSFTRRWPFVPRLPLLLFTAVLSGLGEAMVLPALSAFVLDMTAEQHRSRAMGIKESAAALGGVVGPLLVISASAVTDAPRASLSSRPCWSWWSRSLPPST